MAKFGKEGKREHFLELLQLLKKQEVNGSDLAKEIGLSRSTISRYGAEITKKSPSQKSYQKLINKITNSSSYKSISGHKAEEELEGYEGLKEHLVGVMRRLDAIEESNRRIEKALKIDPPGGESSGESIPQGN